MSRVEKLKRTTKRFLSEQYHEFAPPRVKKTVSKVRSYEPRVRESYRTRSVRGKAKLKEIITKRTGKLPISIPKLPGQKKRRKK